MTQSNPREFPCKVMAVLALLAVSVVSPRQARAIIITQLGNFSGNVNPDVSVTNFAFIYKVNWDSGSTPESPVFGVFGWQSLGTGATSNTVIPTGSLQNYVSPQVSVSGLYPNPTVTSAVVAITGTYINASSSTGLFVAFPSSGTLPLGESLDTFLGQTGAEAQLITDVETGSASQLEQDFLQTYPSLSYSAGPNSVTPLTFIGFTNGTNEGVASNGFNATPEPASLAIFAVGGIAFLKRRARPAVRPRLR